MNGTKRLVRLPALALAVFAAVGALPATAQVVATEAWAEATRPGAKSSLGYMLLTNQGKEEAVLIGVESKASTNTIIQIKNPGITGTAGPSFLTSLKLPPGLAVRLKPDGLHVPFEGLKAPFVAGKKVPLTLTFLDGPDLTVQLDVRAPETAAPGNEAAKTP